MARPKRDDDENLSVQLGVRVNTRDHDRIKALAARFPITTGNGVARRAMQIGLDAIEADPTLLLESTKPTPPKATKKRG